MAPIVRWATRYGELGFRIVPLLPKQKRPPCQNWQHLATSNVETIRSWWDPSRSFTNPDGSRWRGNPDYGIALVTGRLDPGEITERLVMAHQLRPGQPCYINVVDLDQHPEDGRYGRDVAASWQADEERFPDTWTAETGSGGAHLYFLSDVPLPRQQHLYDRSVDFQAADALIVLPPSVHPNGKRYFWDVSPGDVEPAFINDNVLRFLAQGKTNDVTTGDRKLPEEIPEGRRTTTLFRLLTRLRAQGLGKSAIRQAIITENDERCKPPLTRDELEKEVLGALDKAPSEPRSTFQLEDHLTGAARVNDLCRAVYFLLGKGFSIDTTKQAIRHENSVKCNPPLSEEEIEERVFPAILRFYGGGI